MTCPRWFNMELSNEEFFFLATFAMITVIIAAVVRETYSSVKIMQPISPNYIWENGVKLIKITEEHLSQSFILCQLLRRKTLAFGSKYIKHFCFLFLPLFTLYLLSRCDLFNMSCLSQISFMAILDILCSNLFNLKHNITKIEHKKIFCVPSKIFKNISWPIDICLKYFMTPTKALPPSSYILNVRSLSSG